MCEKGKNEDYIDQGKAGIEPVTYSMYVQAHGGL